MINFNRNKDLIDEDIYQVLDKYTPFKLRPCYNEQIFKSPVNNRYHYIYCIIHISTKRFYIGKRSEKYDTNYLGSGNHIKSAIALYGKNEFYKFVTSFHYNSHYTSFRESFLLNEKILGSEDSFNKKNYTGLGVGKWK